MMYYYTFILLLFMPLLSSSHVFTLSEKDIRDIGLRIWKNECEGTKEGLTCWKDGENWLSVGIGHCIWFPEQRPPYFIEEFPNLIDFFLKQKRKVPEWLIQANGKLIPCPWNSQEEFRKEFLSPRAQELRDFFSRTIDIQALFMVKRLERLAKTGLLKFYNKRTRAHIIKQFNRLIKTPMGAYALIDYLNFKGSGLTPLKENYKGSSWGLIQVLRQMPESYPPDQALTLFVATAKKVLAKRVENAPPERHEEQWIPGWYKRLDSYLQ